MSTDNLKKREIVATTNSHGWHYIKELAEVTLANMEREAIDEEDDTRGTTLRRQAKAARKFYLDFLTNVESLRHAEVGEVTNTPTSDDFYEVAS